MDAGPVSLRRCDTEHPVVLAEFSIAAYTVLWESSFTRIAVMALLLPVWMKAAIVREGGLSSPS
jgi:hypothetical protein